MDTTGGLTTQILTNAERGRAIDHLDIYPDIINSLSLDKVNGAIKSYINPDRLVTVAAGTFE
jgi:zinc protease